MELWQSVWVAARMGLNVAIFEPLPPSAHANRLLFYMTQAVVWPLPRCSFGCWTWLQQVENKCSLTDLEDLRCKYKKGGQSRQEKGILSSFTISFKEIKVTIKWAMVLDCLWEIIKISLQCAPAPRKKVFCMVFNWCLVYRLRCRKQTFNKVYHPIC